MFGKKKKEEKKPVKSEKENKAVAAKEETTKSAPKAKTKKVETKETLKKTEVKKTVKTTDKKVSAKKTEEKKQVEEKKAESTGIYRVVYDKTDRLWKIKKDGAKRVIATMSTKESALARVKELSETKDIGYVVHKKDGKFQKK